MPVRLRFSTWDEHFSKVLTSVRSNFAASFGRGESRRQAIRFEISIVLLIYLSKGYFAEKHQPRRVPSRWLTVIGRFGSYQRSRLLCRTCSLLKVPMVGLSLGLDSKYRQNWLASTHAKVVACFRCALYTYRIPCPFRFRRCSLSPTSNPNGFWNEY